MVVSGREALTLTGRRLDPALTICHALSLAGMSNSEIADQFAVKRGQAPSRATSTTCRDGAGNDA